MFIKALFTKLKGRRSTYPCLDEWKDKLGYVLHREGYHADRNTPSTQD